MPIVDVRGAWLDLGIPLIETDDETVVRLAVEHFQERGFRQFAYCGFPGANYSDKRGQYFTTQLAQAGFPCDVYQPPAPPRGTMWELERARPELPRPRRSLAEKAAQTGRPDGLQRHSRPAGARCLPRSRHPGSR